MKIQITSAALLALTAACVEVPQTPFDGRDVNGSRVGGPAVVVVSPPLSGIPAPDPIVSRPLGNPATPRPSTNGMAPPPVEIGVIGGDLPPPPPPPSDDT